MVSAACGAVIPMDRLVWNPRSRVIFGDVNRGGQLMEIDCHLCLEQREATRTQDRQSDLVDASEALVSAVEREVQQEGKVIHWDSVDNCRSPKINYMAESTDGVTCVVCQALPEFLARRAEQVATKLTHLMVHGGDRVCGATGGTATFGTRFVDCLACLRAVGLPEVEGPVKRRILLSGDDQG